MKKYILLLSCILITALTACSASTEKLQNNALQSSTRNKAVINNGTEKTYKKNSADAVLVAEEEGNEDNEIEKHEKNVSIAEDRAKIVADYVSSMDSIGHSAVVITGNTAIIGISLQNELDVNQLVYLKRKIIKEVKQVDKEIDHVAISSAPDLYEKINHLSGSQNAEDQEIKQELEKNEGNDIFFRIVPTV